MWWKHFYWFFLASIGIKANCPNDFIMQDDSIYILSDEVATYKSAEERCQSNGGHIARIATNERKIFHNKFQYKYLRGLANVEILTKQKTHQPETRPDDQNYTFTYDSYIFRSSYENNQDTRVDFASPSGNELKSIMLYKTSTESFSRAIHFCWSDNGGYNDMVRDRCNNGWKPNFILYGGENNSTGKITIYNYIHSGITSKLALKEIKDNSSFTLPNVEWLKYIHIPDISIFTGTKSVEESKQCSVETWPLTYDDGVNLQSKHCDSNLAYYICHIQVKVSAKKLKCDGKSLNITLLNVRGFSCYYPEYQINVGDTNVTLREENVSVVVGNLLECTFYNVQVTIRFRRFYNSPLVITTNGTTGCGDGKPGNVTNPIVKNYKPNNCLISWEYDEPDIHEITFKIMASVPDTNVSQTFEVPTTNPPFQTIINVSKFGFEKFVLFQILAVSSCGNASKPIDVKGCCITEAKNTLKTKKTMKATAEKAADNTNTWMIVAIALICVLGLETTYIICKRLTSTALHTRDSSCQRPRVRTYSYVQDNMKQPEYEELENVAQYSNGQPSYSSPSTFTEYVVADEVRRSSFKQLTNHPTFSLAPVLEQDSKAKFEKAKKAQLYLPMKSLK